MRAILRRIARWAFIAIVVIFEVYLFLNACELEPHFGSGTFLRALFGLVGMD